MRTNDVLIAFCFLVGGLVVAGGARGEDTTGADSVSVDERLETLTGRVESLTEQTQVLQSDTDKLKKLKFSGYVQARWETAENKSDSVRVAGDANTRGLAFTAANNERFYIRRARLKLTAEPSPLSQAVVYFDGGQDRTIRLLEAYATLLSPWNTWHHHALAGGQMNVPFGYEIERSSSVRELPERSRAENVLFSGERDRGVKLVSQWGSRFETVLGVFNGGGVNHPDFPNTDPTRGKDILGRARFSEDKIEAAVSVYSGRNTLALTGPDVQTDKTRLGADAQYYYELPAVGGGSLKGEVYSGKEFNPDSVRTHTRTVRDAAGAATARVLRANAPTDHFATDFLGWYAMWVQNLGEKFQAAARFEKYDPNTDVDHDQFERVSLGLNYFYDGSTRVTVSYDIPTTDVRKPDGSFADPKDNLWIAQLQLKY